MEVLLNGQTECYTIRTSDESCDGMMMHGNILCISRVYESGVDMSWLLEQRVGFWLFLDVGLIGSQLRALADSFLKRGVQLT